MNLIDSILIIDKKRPYFYTCLQRTNKDNSLMQLRLYSTRNSCLRTAL